MVLQRAFNRGIWKSMTFVVIIVIHYRAVICLESGDAPPITNNFESKNDSTTSPEPVTVDRENFRKGSFFPVFIPVATVTFVVCIITLLYLYLYLQEKQKEPEIPPNDERFNEPHNEDETSHELDVAEHDRETTLRKASEISRQIKDVEVKAIELRTSHSGLPNASTA